MTPEQEQAERDVDYIQTKWIKANGALVEGDYKTAYELLLKMSTMAEGLPGARS